MLLVVTEQAMRTLVLTLDLILLLLTAVCLAGILPDLH